MNIWALILLFGALHGFFISGVFLFMKRGTRNANLSLAALVFIISLQLTASAGSISGLYEFMPHLMHVHTPLIYLIGPLIYFYIKFSLSVQKNFRSLDILNLIPFLISIYSLLSFYPLSAEVKLAFLHTPATTTDNPVHLLMWNLYAVSILSYTILSAKLVYKKTDALKNNFSKLRNDHFRILKRLLSIFSVYLLLSFILLFYLTFSGIYYPILDFASLCIFAVFIHTIAYIAMKEPDQLFLVRTQDIVKNSSISAENITGNGSRKLTISRDKVNKILVELDILMSEKKLYLENELKISDVAEKLNIPTHKLSILLNSELKLNFYDYVNSFRVKEAQRKLTDSKFSNYTILGIALDAGFNSKASFNRIFKKITGLTPSDYIKSNKSQVYNKSA